MTGPIDLVFLGLPKTGTTWIANTLARSDGLQVFDEADKIETLWARRAGQGILVAESATDPLFLSDIGARHGSLSALANRLPPGHVVLVLREPDDWMCSLYRQYLRRGGTGLFRDFVGPGGIVDPAFADYGRLVDEATAAFEAPVSVCSYAGLKADPRSFLERIAAAVWDASAARELVAGVPADALAERANVGVRRLGARTVRRFNRLRRTRRWNPDGLVRWRGFERLPWHLLAGIGPDVVEPADYEWLAECLAPHTDWPEWRGAFMNSPVIHHD